MIFINLRNYNNFKSDREENRSLAKCLFVNLYYCSCFLKIMQISAKSSKDTLNIKAPQIYI